MSDKEYRIKANFDLLDMFREKKRPILRRWERLMNNRNNNDEEREEIERLRRKLDLIDERVDGILNELAELIDWRA